jgi:hypothetical protein
VSELRLEPVENRRRAVALRFHARARRGYWGSRWAAVLPAEWFEADAAPVIAEIRKCGRLATIEAVAPQSGDSWEDFLRRHKDTLFGPDGREYTASGSRYGDASPRPTSAAPARAQQAWEAARAEREAAFRAESDRQWRQADRERLDTLARLGLTEQGELTPVYWQTEALYRVEGARRLLRASRG